MGIHKNITLNTAVALALLASGTFLTQSAVAEENLWVYATGTDTRPKGSWELKLGTVSRLGKADSHYEFHDVHAEVEYGVSDKLTVGAELMFFNHNYSTTNPDLQPYFDTQGGAGGSFKNTSLGGYEIKAKYNILSPYKDSFGFSLGFAFDHRYKYRLDGADISQNAIEIYGYFQKNFLDDTLVFAFTPKIEFENRTSPGVIEEEIAFDFSVGASYRVAPKWFVGVEFRHQSDYLNPQEDGVYDPDLKRSKFGLEGFQLGSQHQNGNYFGPTVHFSEKQWWVTAGALFQVFGGGSVNAFVRDGKNWDEHESAHLRMTVGYEF